jgi:hypothetical protein
LYSSAPLILLPNKANNSTIQLAPTLSAALKKVVESSISEAIKLIEFAGDTSCNKNSKMSYQDRYTAYMTKAVVVQYDVEAIGSLMHCFAEVSATCYQSFSYAAAELHHDITFDLVQDICDGKGRTRANHMETNIIRGLSCTSTMLEVAVIALLILWPYLSIIHSWPSVVDMPDLVDLH